MTTLDTLRQLQAEATPGPWEVDDTYGDVVQAAEHYQQTGEHRWERQGIVQSAHVSDADARLIAAAPTHLADLITALEQIERVRYLHKRVEIQGSDGFGGLKTIGYECDYCGEHLDIFTYPCPTIRILDGNE